MYWNSGFASSLDRVQDASQMVRGPSEVVRGACRMSFVVTEIQVALGIEFARYWDRRHGLT